MAQTTLVDRFIAEGRQLVDALRAKGHVVPSAVWIRSVDSIDWRLHLCLQDIDTLGYREAYQIVDETMRELKLQGFELFDIRLMNVSDPVARDVAARQSQWPAPIDTVFRGYELGDLPIEEAFIYAPATAQSQPLADAATQIP